MLLSTIFATKEASIFSVKGFWNLEKCKQKHGGLFRPNHPPNAVQNQLNSAQPSSSWWPPWKGGPLTITSYTPNIAWVSIGHIS